MVESEVSGMAFPCGVMLIGAILRRRKTIKNEQKYRFRHIEGSQYAWDHWIAYFESGGGIICD